MYQYQAGFLTTRIFLFCFEVYFIELRLYLGILEV